MKPSKLSVTMSSNFQRTFAHLVAAIDVLNNPPPLQHAPGLPPTVTSSTTPSSSFPSSSLHTTSSGFSYDARPPTQLFLQHPQLMDPFGLSLRLVENRNLSTKGIPTPTTSRGPVATYCGDVTLTTKQLERKESVATLQFLTTGDLPTSTIEWSRPHSHAPDSGKIGAISVWESMKTDAVISTRMTHKIVADGLLDTSRDVQYNLPPKKSLKRMIRPLTRFGLWQTSNQPPHSSGSLAVMEVLRLRVWYGSNSHADYWWKPWFPLPVPCDCMEMELSKLPQNFGTQLYTIHRQKNGFTVPCVFALLPDKRKETYTRLFRQLKLWLSEFSTTWDFESYLSDFKKGANLAAKYVFTGIREEGCFFHMAKRLDLYVKQLGLMPKYQIDMGFRTRVKFLAALAFIPVLDLVAVYEALSTTFLADEISLLHYFESTCIGMGVGADGLIRDPAFPHQMWNVLNRHDQGSTRTTNALEAFHHSFQCPDQLPASVHQDPPRQPEASRRYREDKHSIHLQRRGWETTGSWGSFLSTLQRMQTELCVE